MTIGINARFLLNPYTGIGQYTRNLLSALSKIDAENQYFLAVPEKIDLNFGQNFHFKIIPEIKYASASIKKTWWEQVQVPKFFKEKKVDLVHFFYPCNPTFPLNIPAIVTVHDTIPWENPIYRPRLLSKLYHANSSRNLIKANLIITVSKTVKNKLLKITDINPDKIIPVYNAASSLYYEPVNHHLISQIKQKYALKNPFFLYVGGYDQRKNVSNLVQAFSKFIAPNYSVDLVLIGGKTLNNDLYRDYDCASMNLSRTTDYDTIKPLGTIIKTGFISEEELKALYHSCLSLVSVSQEEGFNIPLIEAAACQTPLVISDIEIHREIVGENALYCDQNSPKNIAETLIQVINDTKLLSELKEKSKKIASRYSWKKSAQEVFKIYQKIGSRLAAGRH